MIKKVNLIVMVYVVRLIKNILKKVMWQFPSSIVFMFHHITDTPEYKKSGCILHTEDFYNIIENIDSFSSSDNYFEEKPKRQRHKVIVTFDDGLSDVYNIAYPFLKQRQIPFTIFVIKDFLDTMGYITSEQLIEMSKDPLVTIGSHGISHDILTGLSSEQKWNEIYNSKIILENLINRNIKFFAYSHGQYDRVCLKMIKKAGYSGAFGVTGLPVNFFTIRWKYHYPRYNITNEELSRIESVLKSF